jgi:outer membrane protein OmpA-like peptidoglycan-associated protein
MKKLFLLFWLCGILTYAQQNLFSGKVSPSLEGMATFSHTDYESSVTKFGLKLYGDYYLPIKSSSAFGLRLTLSKFQIGGEDPNKNPAAYKTDIFGTGFGFTYMHSSNNIFYKTMYAGLSYIWFDPMLESGGPAPNNRRNLYEKSSQVYDLNFGIKYLISPVIALNTSIGIHFLQHDNLDDLKAGDHFDVFSDFNLGISFVIGNTGDVDRDGIPASKDKCPDAPEDFDGFEDEDGCPDPDNDNDGIPDIIDPCPNLAEDFDGYEDSDGCPDSDNDKDGIPDNIDQCPDEPEDFDGYLDSDGCPDNDNDNDNIPDSLDKCPNSAEDYDGFQDDDGCPDTDNDKDGIPDNLDKCPDIPEDMDGISDNDGCPDKDNDGDGIPDVFDKCPNEKEIYNGYLDDDGCPDEAPETVKQDTKVPPVKPPDEPKKETPKFIIPDSFTLEGVLTFVDDDYEIKPGARAELDRIADLIKKDSTSRWRIEGHTDNVRPENENLKLSQQRATEVLLYFVKKGLRYSRFEAVGLGSRYPIADNSKPSGKAKNRRVVIKRIK